MDAWAIRFTRDAAKDIEWWQFSSDEFDQMIAALKHVAALVDPCAAYNVCDIECTAGQWKRLKVKDCNARVCFEVVQSKHMIVVRAVFKRTANTYRMVEWLWRAEKVTA